MMRMKPIATWLWFGCALLLLSCDPPPERSTALRILEMPTEQRLRAMSELPPEKQVDVFLYAYTSVEPPKILAGEVAQNWKVTLPVIKDRLAKESRESYLDGLMLTLSAISARYCSLADRTDVLLVASRAVEKIGPPYRELADEQLARLKQPSADLPPCR